MNDNNEEERATTRNEKEEDDQGHKHGKAACSAGHLVQRILDAGALLHGNRGYRRGDDSDQLLFQRVDLASQ